MTQKTIKYTERDFYNTYIPETIGEEVILLEHENTMNGNVWWTLVKHDGRGIGGNMNHEIRRYHGWRGTSYDIAVNAYGVRKVTKIRSAVDKNGYPECYVTVGKDIHPDWE